MPCGRQWLRTRKGRPAFSSVTICWTWGRMSGFQCGTLLCSWRFWSPPSGSHTPSRAGGAAARETADIETRDIPTSAAIPQANAKLLATEFTPTKPLLSDTGCSQRPLEKLLLHRSPNHPTRRLILVAAIANEKSRRGAWPRHSNMGALYLTGLSTRSGDLVRRWAGECAAEIRPPEQRPFHPPAVLQATQGSQVAGRCAVPYWRDAPLNRHAASSVRLWTPKRLHRLATCSFTVWSEIPISRAISLLVRPRQTRIATSAERGGKIVESAAAGMVAGGVRGMIAALASSSICPAFVMLASASEPARHGMSMRCRTSGV